jgi:urease accessory protein
LDDGALYRLMSWLSPAYPVGAFSYSHGIEWAVEAGDIAGAESLEAWLADLLRYGSGRNDAILFTVAWRAVTDGDRAALAEAAEWGTALAGSKERRLETLAQGTAFVRATADVWSDEILGAFDNAETPYPVAVAAAAASAAIPLRPALHATLHAFAANLISAGVRLIPLGQTDGLRVLAALEPVIAAALDETEAAMLDDLGGATIRADIASMRHETQYTRLFRS